MKCNIRGEKLEATEAIKNYLEEKIGKLDKYFKDENITANIVIKTRGNQDVVEVTIPTTKFTLRSETENPDLYAAIDLASEKLERQIRKNKTRLQRFTNDISLKEFNFDFEETIDEEENNQIIKRKTISTKPMDEEEAILEMELLGHTFFVYKDMHTNNTNILYKRKDGNYGLIETD